MKYILYLLYFASLSLYSQIIAQNSKENIKQEQMKDTKYNPEAIIQSLIDAMKANDTEKIRSLFNANASQAYGDGAAKSGKAFFRWLDSDIIDRTGHVDNAEFKTNGNEVVVTGQYSSIGYTNKANFLFTVKDGEIMSWQMRY